MKQSPFFRDYKNEPKTKGISPLLDEQVVESRYNTAKQEPKKNQEIRTKKSVAFPLKFDRLEDPKSIEHISTEEPLKDPEYENWHGELNALLPTVKRKVVTRHSFVSALESIGSLNMWLLILAPIITVVIACSTTKSWRTQSTIIDLTDCQQLPEYCWSDAELITVKFPLSINDIGYVNSYFTIANVDYSSGLGEPQEPFASLQPYLIDSNGAPVGDQTIFPSYSVSYQTLELLKGVNVYDQLQIPVPAITFNQPGVAHGSPTWLAIDISVPYLKRMLATRLDTSSYTFQFTYTTIRPEYVSAFSIIDTVLSSVTFITLLATVWNVIAHATHLKHSLESEQGADQSPPDPDIRSRVTHFILPEQYFAMFLLFFLLMWQCPIRLFWLFFSTYADSPLQIKIPHSDGLLFTLGLLTSLGCYGLFFGWASYVDGMRFNPYARKASSSISDRHQSRTPEPFWMLNEPVDVSTAQHDWLHQTPLHYPNSSNRNYDPFFQKSPQQSNDSLFLYQVESRSEVRPDFWTDSDTRHSRNHRESFSLADEEEAVPLGDADSTTNARALYLTPHHPSSRTFNDFFVPKFALLLVSWLAVGLYWTLLFPDLCGYPYHDELAKKSVATAATVLKVLVGMCSLVWILLIFKYMNRSGRLLRGMKFSHSRFRQIAFRTFVVQVYLGFFLFLGLLIHALAVSKFYQYLEFEGVTQFLTFHHLWLRYVGFYSFLVPKHPLQIPNLELRLLVSFMVYTVVLAVQPPEQFKHSSERSGQTAELQAFVSLLRNMPVSKHEQQWPDGWRRRKRVVEDLKGYLVNSQIRRFTKLYMTTLLEDCKMRRSRLFCLETALLLLEASYQAYFPSENSGKGVNIQTTANYGSLRVEEIKISQNKDVLSADEEQEPVSGNPFAPPEKAPLSSGPRLDLSRLGLKLLQTFKSEELCTFGYLGVAEGVIVVSFRGSVVGNMSTDLKLTQVPLPNLKRTKLELRKLVRRIIAEEGRQQETEESHDLLDETVEEDSDEEYVSLPSERQTRSDSDFEMAEVGIGTPNDSFNNFGKEEYDPLIVETEMDLENVNSEKSSKCFSSVASCLTAIPILNQNFPRVHKGFWEAYESVREEFFCGLIRAIVLQRRRHLVEDNANADDDEIAAGAEGKENRRASPLTPFTQQNSSLFPTDYYVELSHTHCRTRDNSPHTKLSPESSPCYSPTAHRAEEINALEIYFSGHSLGAAISSIAALETSINLKRIVAACAREELFQTTSSSLEERLERIPRILNLEIPQLSIYTFGSPRIGNAAFARKVQRKIKTIYRVEVNGDFITMIPKFGGFYRHIGSPVVVDEDATGSILVHPSIIEMSFLKRTTGNLANHSLDRYRLCMEAGLDPQELKEYLLKEYYRSNAGDSQQGGKVASKTVPAWILSQH